MFAGNSHSHVFAVKLMQGLQVVADNAPLLLINRCFTQCSGFKVLGYLAAKPGSPLCRPADHNARGAGVLQHLARLEWAIDIAVGVNGYINGVDDL